MLCILCKNSLITFRMTHVSVYCRVEYSSAILHLHTRHMRYFWRAANDLRSLPDSAFNECYNSTCNQPKFYLYLN